MSRARRKASSGAASSAGFSLIELIVALLIAVEILIAAGVAFDVHNRVANVQLQVADLQQSLRVAQYDIARTLRAAGRGGLPVEQAPAAIYNVADPIPALQGLSIEVRNNVAGANRQISRTIAGQNAVAGTDILTLRGCLSTPLFQVQPADFDQDPDGDGILNTATLKIDNTSVAGVRQPLQPLLEEINAYAPGATVRGTMILVSTEAREIYGIANITSAVPSDATPDPASVQLNLNLATNSTLNPVNSATGVRSFPDNLPPALACYLEEYRYYVREVFQVPGDTTSVPMPRLARARFEPGTENPYLGNASNFSIDLSEGVFDLQVALGFDTDFVDPTQLDPGNPLAGSFDDDTNNQFGDDVIYEAPLPDGDRTSDDWLYNDPGDRTGDADWTTHGLPGRAGDLVRLYFVRVSTLARTAKPDRTYQAPDFSTRATGDWVEDQNFDAAPNNVFKTVAAKRFRHRMLTSIVALRNN